MNISKYKLLENETEYLNRRKEAVNIPTIGLELIWVSVWKPVEGIQQAKYEVSRTMHKPFENINQLADC
jgi:hypothetical protein